MNWDEARTILSSFVQIYELFNDDKGAIQMGIEALGKQIPRKPYNNASHESNGKIYYDISQYRCPSCTARLKSGLGSSSHYRNEYCNKCGQKIDWSEVER